MALKLLTGTFESTLDDKGRVGIPASLRDRYKGELVITQGHESCVWIMTGAAFEKLQENIDKTASSLNIEYYMALHYQHVTSAQESVIDQKSGRIPVPAALRSYAGLLKDCLIISIDVKNDQKTSYMPAQRLEIWNTDAYRAFMQEVQVKAKKAMRKLGPLSSPDGGQS
jgi:MraZ protein